MVASPGELDTTVPFSTPSHKLLVTNSNVSEAIEDLTGGVTTELLTTDILDTDMFWTNEVMKVNAEFLFGCATGRFDRWQGSADTDIGARKGVIRMQ